MSFFKNKFFVIYLSLVSLSAIFIITFSILGNIERVGYISNFNSIDQGNTYHFQVGYRNNIFRHSDIYGVYPENVDLPDYITNIEWDGFGSPFGTIVSTKELEKDFKIDINYTLRVKPDIYLYSIAVLLLILLTYILNKKLSFREYLEAIGISIVGISKLLKLKVSIVFMIEKLCGLVSYFPILLLLLWGNVILTSLILSIFKQLNNIFLYTMLILFFSLCTYFFSKRAKLIPVKRSFKFDSSMSQYFSPFVLLFLALSVIVLLSFIACFTYPPNNWDSLTYHLPRIFLYFSQGHLGHFFTTWTPQIALPFNNTLLQMLVVQYDLPHSLFSLINFLCYVSSGIMVYKISRYLKVNQFFSFVSMFVGMTGIMVVAQSSTTQSDMLLAFPTLIGFYYAMKYFDSFKMRYALLATLSFGIACGVKPTIVYGLPIIMIAGIFIIVTSVINKKANTTASNRWYNYTYIHYSLYGYKLLLLRKPIGP